MVSSHVNTCRLHVCTCTCTEYLRALSCGGSPTSWECEFNSLFIGFIGVIHIALLGHRHLRSSINRVRFSLVRFACTFRSICNSTFSGRTKTTEEVLSCVTGQRQPQDVHFLSQPRNTTAVTGNDVTLECLADGNPKPIVSWFKGNHHRVNGCCLRGIVIWSCHRPSDVRALGANLRHKADCKFCL